MNATFYSDAVLIPSIVLDTNIVLDCFIFFDLNSQNLCHQISTFKYRWISTPDMEKEYLRVLQYPPIQKIIQSLSTSHQLTIPTIFKKYATQVPCAPKAPFAQCKDPDDQKFIDLAIAHRCCLLSKDKAVLRLRPQLSRQGVTVQSTPNT